MSDTLKDLESMQVAVAEFRKISKANRVVLLGLLNKDHELLADKVDDPYHQIRDNYRLAGGRVNNSNNFIQTIRQVREVGQLGLKEAKELVETW